MLVYVVLVVFREKTEKCDLFAVFTLEKERQ